MFPRLLRPFASVFKPLAVRDNPPTSIFAKRSNPFAILLYSVAFTPLNVLVAFPSFDTPFASPLKLLPLILDSEDVNTSILPTRFVISSLALFAVAFILISNDSTVSDMLTPHYLSFALRKIFQSNKTVLSCILNFGNSSYF